MDDIWDPNTWGEPIRFRTITLSGDGAVFAIVDEENYDELMEQGPWNLYEYRSKRYAKRTRRKAEWKQPATIYMHIWLAQKYLRRPSPKHIIVDHKHSNGLDNRKKKLRWCTPRDNRLNIYGMWFQSNDFLEQLHRETQAERRAARA